MSVTPRARRLYDYEALNMPLNICETILIFQQRFISAIIWDSHVDFLFAYYFEKSGFPGAGL